MARRVPCRVAPAAIVRSLCVAVKPERVATGRHPERGLRAHVPTTSALFSPKSDLGGLPITRPYRERRKEAKPVPPPTAASD